MKVPFQGGADANGLDPLLAGEGIPGNRFPEARLLEGMADRVVVCAVLEVSYEVGGSTDVGRVQGTVAGSAVLSRSIAVHANRLESISNRHSPHTTCDLAQRATPDQRPRLTMQLPSCLEQHRPLLRTCHRHA